MWAQFVQISAAFQPRAGCVFLERTSEVHPVFNPVAPYRYLLPNLYLSVADIANPDLFACSSWTRFSLDITSFYEEHCQPSSESAKPACPTNGNQVPIAGGEMGRHNLQCLPDRCDSSTACRLCRLEPNQEMSVTPYNKGHP